MVSCSSLTSGVAAASSPSPFILSFRTSFLSSLPFSDYKHRPIQRKICGIMIGYKHGAFIRLISTTPYQVVAATRFASTLYNITTCFPHNIQLRMTSGPGVQ